MPEIKVLNLSKRAPEHLQPPPNWKKLEEYVYIGRYNSRSGMASIFENTYTEKDIKRTEPWRKTKEEIRDRSIALYKEWFTEKYFLDPIFAKYVNNLIGIATHGNLYLVCWCAPLPCHGDVIREFILQRLGRFY